MTNAVFKLEESGFTRDQVNALTEFMDGSVATKADIAELSGELKGVRGELKADIAELSGEFKADIATLSGEVKTDIERLEGKIIGLDGKIIGLDGKMNTKFEKMDGKINIVYWMLGLIIAVQVAPYLKTIFG